MKKLRFAVIIWYLCGAVGTPIVIHRKFDVGPLDILLSATAGGVMGPICPAMWLVFEYLDGTSDVVVWKKSTDGEQGNEP